MSNDTVQLTSGKSMLRTSSAVRGRRGGGGGGWGCEANDMRVTTPSCANASCTYIFSEWSKEICAFIFLPFGKV